MKRAILIFFMVTFVGLELQAQTIFSNGTGGGAWSSGSTWMGGVVPNANSDVIIAGTDSVYTTVGAVCANLTVLSGGKLSTGVDSIQVSSTFTLEADAKFYNAVTRPTVPGTIRDLDAASTVIHSGSGTVGGAGNLEFGNLVIQRVEGTVPGGNLLIKGDLIINNSAANVVFRGVRPVTGSQTHTVMGNLIINMGTVSCIDVGDNSMVGIFNIKGNVILTGPDARFSCFSSANAAGLAIYNIDGNIINNGGRIQAGTSSSSGPGTGIINLKGNFTFNSGTFSTNSLGPFAINFVRNGVQNFYLRGVNVNLNTNLHDTVAVGSTVIMDLDTNKWGSSTGGDFTVFGTLEMKNNSRLTGSGTFDLKPGATLRIGSPDGISASSMLGSVQMIGGRNYSTEADYTYSGTALQQTGDGLPATVNRFTVTNSQGVILNNDLTVTTSLATSGGDLDLNGKTVTMAGTSTLIETAGNTVKGTSGKIQATRDLSAPSAVNVAGLGAVITSSSNLGSTLVERYHSARNGTGNQSILRAYNIQPANNSNLNATLRFYYDESELNGAAEARLMMCKSPNGNDNTWHSIGGAVNVNENYVERALIQDFFFFTLADSDRPLPVEGESEGVPSEFILEQNYPNPFNPSTVIRFALPVSGYVNLSVYNMLGEKVAELVSRDLDAGYHTVNFSGANLSSGMYLYKISADGYSLSRKMNLIK